MRVLAIDDDKINRLLLRVYLEDVVKTHDHSFEFQICSSGKEAILESGKAPFDIVFTDMMMPEMDGIDAICKIKEACVQACFPEPAFIVISACDEFESIKKAHEMGVLGYLIKPIRQTDLVDWIQVVSIEKRRNNKATNGDLASN